MHISSLTVFEVFLVKFIMSDASGAIYVVVISRLGGMLRVYRPETRGRVAPEGRGSINRNIPTRRDITNL